MTRALFALLLCSRAGADDPSASDSDSDVVGNTGDCEPSDTDPTKYVTVGFWDNDPTCTGDPVITNSFPVSDSAGCYFRIDDKTPTVKTSFTDACEQDIPANLYAKIIDYGACGS